MTCENARSTNPLAARMCERRGRHRVSDRTPGECGDCGEDIPRQTPENVEKLAEADIAAGNLGEPMTTEQMREAMSKLRRLGDRSTPENAEEPSGRWINHYSGNDSEVVGRHWEPSTPENVECQT